jgi:hypothetical protein
MSFAARTPNQITGGTPRHYRSIFARDIPAIGDSSTGIMYRLTEPGVPRPAGFMADHPVRPGPFSHYSDVPMGHLNLFGQLRQFMSRDPVTTPQHLGLTGPRAPANSRAGAQYRYDTARDVQRRRDSLHSVPPDEPGHAAGGMVSTVAPPPDWQREIDRGAYSERRFVPMDTTPGGIVDPERMLARRKMLSDFPDTIQNERGEQYIERGPYPGRGQPFRWWGWRNTPPMPPGRRGS